MRTKAVLFILLLTLPSLFLAQEKKEEPKKEEEKTDELETPAITLVNDPASMLNLNVEKEHIISAFIFSNPKITSTQWRLDPKVHNDDVNKAFFEKVKIEQPTEEVQRSIVIPANAGLLSDKETSKEFIIQLTVENEKKKSATESFKIILRKPLVKITFTVDPQPPRGIGLRTDFTFKFKKEGDVAVSYSLSYMRGERLITIASGLNTKTLPDIKYKFPVPRKDEEKLTVTLAYTPIKEEKEGGGQSQVDDYSVDIEVVRPKVFDLKEADALVKAEEDGSIDKVDVAHMTAIVHTIITEVFKHEYFHAGTYKVTCAQKDYCSGNGKCSEVHLYWKKCKCDGVYRGPICGITSDNEKHVIQIFDRILRLLEKAKIDFTNIGHMTEIIKSMASIRYLFDAHLYKNVFKVMNVFLEKVGDSVNDKDVVEDIFIALENMNAALTENFFSEYTDDNNFSPANNNFMIEESRKKIFALIDLIIKRRHNYDRWDHTMESGGISLFTTTPEKMKQVASADLVISAGKGKLTESVMIKIATELLKTVKEGKVSLAIVAYQAYHNPYEAIMTDTVSVISPVVTISLKEKDSATSVEGSVSTDTFKENPIFIGFPKPGDDRVLSKMQCASYNYNKHIFEKSCKTIYTGQGQVICHCEKFGDFALIMPNDTPKKKVTDNVETKDIEKIIKPIFTQMQGIVSGVFMLCLWAFSFLVSLRENQSNPLFSEQLTVHPIYSIVSVYTASISRAVKVHLLFLTLAVQFTAEAFLLRAGIFRSDEQILSALVGVLISIPFNYVFGMLAKVISGGNKIGKKGIMMLIAEALLVVILLLGNYQAALLYEDHIEIMTLFKIWALGAIVDLFALDIFVVIFAKIPPIRSIVTLRGFYSRLSMLSDASGYVIQTDNPLMK